MVNDMTDFRQIKPEDRTRLSGPGLRTFRNIADSWGLGEAERIAALGHPSRSTYHSWMKKAVEGEKISLPADTLLRIAAVLGIYQRLSILFHDEVIHDGSFEPVTEADVELRIINRCSGER